MIRAITLALAGLSAGTAHAAFLEFYEFTGTVVTSDMAGISAGNTFNGSIVLDLRDLEAPGASTARSSLWSSERGCREFINGACSHAPLDQWLFASISVSVEGNPIPLQGPAYSRSQLGQYTAASETAYQVTSYGSTSVINGDLAGGTYNSLYEYHELQLTLSSIFALFNDIQVADQPDLTVPLNSATLTYLSSMGGCSADGFECDPSSNSPVVGFFRGDITSIHVLGEGNPIPEPSGMALAGLALAAASLVRRTCGPARGGRRVARQV